MDNLFFLKEDVEREQKVEKKNLYLEQENVFGFLLSLIFFPFSFSLSSLKVIFFYLLTAVNTFSRLFVVFPLSLFPISTFFFPFLSLSSPIFHILFFLYNVGLRLNMSIFFYFPLSLLSLIPRMFLFGKKLMEM